MKFVTFLGCVASAVNRILPECNDKVQMRKDIRAMNSFEMNRYFNAVKKLNSGRGLSRWDIYARIRQLQYPDIHDPRLFLAWHRMILYAIEKELQRINPNVTIPYWDYSAFSQLPIGRNYVRSKCIVYGPGSRFTARTLDSDKQRIRCLGQDPRLYPNLPAFDQNHIDLKSIANSAEGIEVDFKGLVFSDASDVSFDYVTATSLLVYSQHAFIDKLWFDWQNHPTESYDKYHISLSQRLLPWNATIRVILDPVSSLCYKYTEPTYVITNYNESSHHDTGSNNSVKVPKPLPEELIADSHLILSRSASRGQGRPPSGQGRSQLKHKGTIFAN